MDLMVEYKKTIVDENDLQGLLELSKEYQVDAQLREVPMTSHQAALEWLIPTAIVIYPFTKSLFSTLGKRSGGFIADSVGRLYDKCFGENKEIGEELVTRDGVKEVFIFSRSLSLASRFPNGITVRLLLKENSSFEDVDMASIHFFAAQTIYFEDPENSPITGWIESNPMTSTFDQIMCFNEKTQEIEFVDYIKSSKLKKLVTCRLGDAWNYDPDA